MITDPFTEAIRKENDDLKARLAALEEKLAGLPAEGVFQGERPQYRLLKPFYGPNDHYYDPEDPNMPEGVINYTGVPNEHMEPMNEPARKRMISWLESLPGKGLLPLEYIVEASAKLAHMSKDSALPDFAGKVMAEALRIRATREGKEPPRVELSIPHQVDEPALMGDDKRMQRAQQAKMKNVISSAMTPEATDAAKRGRGRPRRIMGGGVVTEGAIDIG